MLLPGLYTSTIWWKTAICAIWFQNFFFVSSPVAQTTQKMMRSEHIKTYKMKREPKKTLVSLCISIVWLQPSLCILWLANEPKVLHAAWFESWQYARLVVGFTVTRLIIKGSISETGINELTGQRKGIVAWWSLEQADIDPILDKGGVNQAT